MKKHAMFPWHTDQRMKAEGITPYHGTSVTGEGGRETERAMIEADALGQSHGAMGMTMDYKGCRDNIHTRTVQCPDKPPDLIRTPHLEQ